MGGSIKDSIKGVTFRCRNGTLRTTPTERPVSKACPHGFTFGDAKRYRRFPQLAPLHCKAESSKAYCCGGVFLSLRREAFSISRDMKGYAHQSILPLATSRVVYREVQRNLVPALLSPLWSDFTASDKAY